MYLGKVLVLVWMSLDLSQTVFGEDLVCPQTSGWNNGWFPCNNNNGKFWCGSVFGPHYICCNNVCTPGERRRVVNSPTAPPPPPSPAPTTTSTATTTTPKPTTTSTTTTTTTTPKPTTTTTTTTTPKPTTTTTITTTPEPTTTTTTTPKPTATTSRPTMSTTTTTKLRTSTTAKKSKSTSLGASRDNVVVPKYVCPKPGQSSKVTLLMPATCSKTRDCRSKGVDQVCCEGRCVKGVPKPIKHRPLLGIIPRECPVRPYGELLFELQQCKSDEDCWPRICCPDGAMSYCRTAHQRLDLVPVINRIDEPLNRLEKYLQCSPPPKRDLFPKRCVSTMDCLPDLCCAEGGFRYCRPAQKSLLKLISSGGLALLMG